MEAVGKSTVSVTNSQSNTNVVWSHNTKWVGKYNQIPLNGRVPTKIWSVQNVNGMKMNGNRRLTGLAPYNYFIWMFPMHHLEKILALTNIQLSFRGHSPTNRSEILKFLGTIVLMPRFQFGARRNIWISESKYK